MVGRDSRRFGRRAVSFARAVDRALAAFERAELRCLVTLYPRKLPKTDEDLLALELAFSEG